MKYLLFFILLTTTTLNAQVIVASECNPQVYEYSSRTYTPDAGECNVQFVGPLYTVSPVEGRMYTTLQVMAGQTYHNILPLGFGTSYQKGLNVLYMSPYLYESIGHEAAVQRAIDSGFPCPKVITIQAASEFPGFAFN